MKKAIQIVILIMHTMHSFGQSDSISLDEVKYDILKMNKFYVANQLDLRGYDYSNAGINRELYAAAMNVKQSNAKASTASIFVILGLTTAVISIAGSQSNDDGFLQDEISSILTGGIILGASMTAVSIPFYISSGKYKKEAEKHVKIAREMYGG